jgi:DNA polymerase-3 subunit delta'
MPSLLISLTVFPEGKIHYRMFPVPDTICFILYNPEGKSDSMPAVRDKQSDPNWGIIGHEWAVQLLRQHVAEHTQRHAYLFTGPLGVGRRTLAIRLVQALNCPKPLAPGEPCRTCRDCTQIEAMRHPDLFIVQADQVGGVIKIDQVRELQRSLALAPYTAPFRVAILLRLEEANLNTANALLKTLEEPAEKAILLVTAESVERTLPTIASRCEILRLRPTPPEQLAKELQHRWDLTPEKANLLANISGGRPGEAIQLLADPHRLANRQTWLDELIHLLSSSRVERFKFAESRAKDKPILRETLAVWLSFWRDVLLRATGATSQVPILTDLSKSTWLPT